MKKRITSFIFTLMMVSAMVIPALAQEFSSYEAEPSLSYDTAKNYQYEYELAEFYCSEISEKTFGGIYFEGDQLIINVTDPDFSVAPLSLNEDPSANTNTEFRIVTNSLQDLELVKDFLTQYMNTFSIHILDANEITNQVDILLGNYDDTIINEIQKLVEDSFPGTDFLNFVDDSSNSIQATVAYEQPKTYYDIDPQVSTFAFPGMSIKIGSGYYTLGPTTSSSTALSAGHGFQGSQRVYLAASGTDIGYALGYYGGSSGDWSSISGSSSVTFMNNTSHIPSAVGESVTMWGSVSGKTTGKITRVNISVAANPPYATLTGMCEGNYLCALGDSGAGIFNPDISNYYGVQSSALFDANDNWAGKSYFCPILR